MIIKRYSDKDAKPKIQAFFKKKTVIENNRANETKKPIQILDGFCP